MDDSKFFESVQSLAQSLSQWDLLIIGGSMVVIVSTSYYRPDARAVRAAYLLFLPAWAFLAFSIYRGIQVQGSYVAYLLAARQNNSTLINTIAHDVNADVTRQVACLEWALLFLAGWLMSYILWWIFSGKAQRGGGGT
jgi:hypothetical protein